MKDEFRLNNWLFRDAQPSGFRVEPVTTAGPGGLTVGIRVTQSALVKLLNSLVAFGFLPASYFKQNR